MIGYVAMLLCLYFSYSKYFTNENTTKAVLPGTIKKFKLSETSKLNCLYRKNVTTRFKWFSIAFFIEIIITVIYTPIVFILFFMLDNKKTVEFVSLGILGVIALLFEIPNIIIDLYDWKIYSRKKRYYKAAKELYEIKEKKDIDLSNNEHFKNKTISEAENLAIYEKNLEKIKKRYYKAVKKLCEIDERKAKKVANNENFKNKTIDDKDIFALYDKDMYFLFDFKLEKIIKYHKATKSYKNKVKKDVELSNNEDIEVFEDFENETIDYDDDDISALYGVDLFASIDEELALIKEERKSQKARKKKEKKAKKECKNKKNNEKLK